MQVPALAARLLPRVGLLAASRGLAPPRRRRVLPQMAPALLGVSVAQVSILINTQIASHQGVGAVSGSATPTG